MTDIVYVQDGGVTIDDGEILDIAIQSSRLSMD